MTKQAIIERTIKAINQLPEDKAEEISAFADFNNRELLQIDNPHLLCFMRFDPQCPSKKVLAIANFDVNPQYFDLEAISITAGFSVYSQFVDLYSGKMPSQHDGHIVLHGYQFYWLTDK